jgi:hypothetical protein
MQSFVQETVGDFMNACPRLCTQLGLQGLACMGASSKGLALNCQAAARSNAVSLLQPIVEAARRRQYLEQHKQAAAWLVALLQQAGNSTTVAAAAQQLLSIPSVPLDWALQMVAAGVRISYEQLLAAANNMLAGVEVWVQAQQQLGVQTDVPAAAVAICCGVEWVSGCSVVLLATC